jgi:hypothetical protein
MTLKACFHAHDKRVRERHRGARTRSVRGVGGTKRVGSANMHHDGVAKRDLSWAWVEAE